MVMINHATKEITIKIVYYGPGLGGKTTNLEYIYKTANPERKGKLLTVSTESDRTLFFDFLPMELGTIKGMRLRTQLYTVPGQVFYDATRRIVLRGADGVVFVADSQKEMVDANIESVENLKANLKINNLDPFTIPLVFQFNKRDLPNIMESEELNKLLNYRNVPYFDAIAIKGKGVNETLRKIIELVIINLHSKEASLKGIKPIQEKEEKKIEEKQEEKVEIKEKSETFSKVTLESKIEEEKREEIETIEEEIGDGEDLEVVEEYEESEEKLEPPVGGDLIEMEHNKKVDEILAKVGDVQEKLYKIMNELDEIRRIISEIKK